MYLYSNQSQFQLARTPASTGRTLGAINTTLMRFNYILKVLSFILLFQQNSAYSQIWPFTPMIRFGNTVYYKLEDTLTIYLHGTNRSFDRSIKNRYVDVLSRRDSLSIRINGSKYFFKQKNRKEPKNYKEIICYSRRLLKNNNATIKYIKLLAIEDSTIRAIASIRYKNQLFKKREVIEIKREDLKGIFIGPGKDMRILIIILWLGAGAYIEIHG
jgi:hypothetical protein